jgi:hypothetical protein
LVAVIEITIITVLSYGHRRKYCQELIEIGDKNERLVVEGF